MERRNFLKAMSCASGALVAGALPASGAVEQLDVEPTLERGAVSLTAPGIWKFSVGISESITPQKTRNIAPDRAGLKKLPEVKACPVLMSTDVIRNKVILKIPIKKGVYVYGLGLQMQSFQQRGLKKKLRVNADPLVDTGDSHAPVPFFVTTAGFGILIDTARYATFYVGNKIKKNNYTTPRNKENYGNDGWNYMTHEQRFGFDEDSEILVEVPDVAGVDVYVFAGPSMLEAVQRYNLFSGGGVLPPRWGLGFWYRVHRDFSQKEVEAMGRYLRDSKIPCDVLGLEPYWQTHSYSCSYLWSNLYPDPSQMINDLKRDHFQINLWEHPFVHPTSPIYKDLLPLAGDYEVWGGIVPDFIIEKTRKVFGDFHEKEHVDLGISGYKADECDSSDFTGNWSFPELSKFPSGANGEQMHMLFGQKYQDALLDVFNKKNKRTYGLVRSSGAFAAPYPFVLYSDLYDHKVFIHSIAQSGFSGLLWAPEVRHAVSNEDLIRRLQSVIFSPLAMVNAWYLKNVPWKQIEANANNHNQFADNWEILEAQCRKIIELRMMLIPYLHAAFVRYKKNGLPPFRALVLDYPQDPQTINISDQFLVGDNLIVAPVVAGQHRRTVYLPAGDWYDFITHEKFKGNTSYEIDVPIDKIPLFVKAGTILPLAKVTQHTEDPESWKLTAMIFGKNSSSISLFQDDGSFNPQLSRIDLKWSSELGKVVIEGAQNKSVSSYSIESWKQVD